MSKRRQQQPGSGVGASPNSSTSNGNGGATLNRRLSNRHTNGNGNTEQWPKLGSSSSSTGESGATSISNNNNVFQDASEQPNDRLNYLLIKSVGSKCIVTVASGEKFGGILLSAQTEGDLGLVLGQAEKLANAPGEQSLIGDEVFETLVITPKDLMDIQILAPDLTPDVPDGFKTDTDISGKSLEIVDRELQPWKPDEDSLGALGEALEETSLEGNDKHWDQFAVNEKKFGVQSTYDEHYYTTAIDKSAPDYQERLKKAERLAAEITNSSYGDNLHVAEERGLVVDDSGLDEEDKYSGVDRRAGKTSAATAAAATLAGQQPSVPVAKYTPPQFRSKPPVIADPAIISSSLAAGQDGSLVPRKKPVVPSTSSTPQQPKPREDGKSRTANIESELVGNFKDFVSAEVERVNQKKQFLQKREKLERINDLKKFAEDYKISAPVPPDLIPILGKKDKQDLSKSGTPASGSASPITTTSSVASPASLKSNVDSPAVTSTNSTTSTTTSTSATAAAATTTATKKPTVKPKFNFNAAGFKPSAPSFTPAFARPVPPPAQSLSPSLHQPLVGGVPLVASPPVPPTAPALSSTVSGNKQPTRSVSSSNTNTPGGFFGNKVIKPRAWKSKMNPFVTTKAKHKNEETPVVIERAYTTPPTWWATIDISYVDLFNSKHAALYGGIAPGAPGVPGVVRGVFPGTSPSMVLGVDDRGNPIIPTSPPVMPGAQVVPGMLPGYPQYAPQYFGRSPQQAFQMGYMPTGAGIPGQAYAMPVGQYYAPQFDQSQRVPNYQGSPEPPQ